MLVFILTTEKLTMSFMDQNNILTPSCCVPVSERRLVLLGSSAAVRSAAGNTILGREAFPASSDLVLSQSSRRREGHVCGRRLVLVDAPEPSGLQDAAGQCVRLSAPGPHAFLILEVPEEVPEDTGTMVDKMQVQ